jgi:hypothetical protein
VGQGELLSCYDFLQTLPLIRIRPRRLGGQHSGQERGCPPPSASPHLVAAPDADNSQIIIACLFVVAIGHSFAAWSVKWEEEEKKDLTLT